LRSLALSRAGCRASALSETSTPQPPARTQSEFSQKFPLNRVVPAQLVIRGKIPIAVLIGEGGEGRGGGGGEGEGKEQGEGREGGGEEESDRGREGRRVERTHIFGRGVQRDMFKLEETATAVALADDFLNEIHGNSLVNGTSSGYHDEDVVHVVDGLPTGYLHHNGAGKAVG